MTAAVRTRPVISAWSTVSPYGIGADAFRAGLRAGSPTAAPADPQRWNGVGADAHLVPEFNVREVLGRKGTRSMDRVTGLAVAVLGGLLDQDEADRDRETGNRAALVLGTTTGSAASMMDFTRSSLVGARPYDVDPALMPNGVMNCAAGQCAIWHGLRGPNTTLAGGRTAGLLGLVYAARLLRSGRADSVLCAAAEEFSSARYWLERHLRDGDDTALGEGAGVLLVQPMDAHSSRRRPLAEVLAVRSRVVVGTDVGAALTACVSSALAEAQVEAGQVWAASPSDTPGQLGEIERRTLEQLCGAEAVDRIPNVGRLGDLSGATTALQIAMLLATVEDGADVTGPAVVTAVDRDGSVACAVLRMVTP
jgi:3-oxoacyl-[acyl-carrier-protein] synthase II